VNADTFTSVLDELSDCALCPRNCHADRFSGPLGWCRSDASFSISSICIHRGEEPAISGSDGICNIFFTNCNLQCIYCQNHQISDNLLDHTSDRMNFIDVLGQITAILDRGIRRVGFVSPSHFVPQVKAIIQGVQALGYRPVWVYNTNGYDKPETLRTLEGIIDVYLPDFKYMDPDLARRYSGAADYPDFAARALKELYRQKGSALILDDDGAAESGIIVRHLALPGHADDSIKVMEFLAREISPKIHVSLMAQYYAPRQVAGHPQLGRGITLHEYRRVVDCMENLGMHNGWYQEFDSSDFYRPDFNNPNPFE